MAPGILPEATSPLIKSSIGESFSRDSSAPGGGPNSTVAADTGAASETAASIAVNRAACRQNDAAAHGSSGGRVITRQRRDSNGGGAGKINVDLAQAIRHRSRFAVGYGLAVNRHHRLHEHRRAGDEGFLGLERLLDGKRPLLDA